MITNYREIKNEDPIEYIWKNLRYSLDQGWVSDQIAAVHTSDGKANANIKKQARQLGYCIRQSEEYFRAASKVGLATRPTLLYYGAVSLGKALTLLRLDGRYSFDGLRNASKHQHHGLNLLGTIRNARADSGPQNFLSSIECECHQHPIDQSPWGQFALFYESLASPVHRVLKTVTVIKRIQQYGIRQTFPEITVQKKPITDLLNVRFNALDLMKSLPDLFHDLIHFGIQPDLAEGEFLVELQGVNPSGDPSDYAYTLMAEQRTYFMSRVPTTLRDQLLELYKTSYPTLAVQLDGPSSARFSYKADAQNTAPITPPAMVCSTTGDHFFVAKIREHLIEPASMYMLLYNFGMLSRYYADVWIDTLDAHVKVAELLDLFFNACYRKFPNLILDQLTNTHHHVSLV